MQHPHDTKHIELTLEAVLNSKECFENRHRFYPIDADHFLVRDGGTGIFREILHRDQVPDEVKR